MDSSILAEGLSVNIKRTDGRIHSALVSGINMDNKSVTVEWFERGETKGKEVELTSVLALNPDVILPSQDRRLSKQDSSEESEEISSLSKRDINKNQSTATLNMRSPRPSTSRTSNSFTGRVPVPSHSLKTKPSTPDVGKSPSTPSVMRHSFQGSTPVTTSSNSRPGVPARRSNVVKEVERLKKNREERRMRQAEEKAEKEALMNQDPGNPNWELSNMIRDYQALLEYKPIKLSDSIEEHQIIVCVRKRPLNKKEITRREIDVISIPSKNTIIVHEPKNKVDLTKYLENQQFRFDFVFDESCKNDIVYKFSAQPLVKTIFEGGMATCFAYGQTGSGKTHTMGGVYGKNQSAEDGIYALVAKDVFAHLASPKFHNLIVSASFFEIYSGRVFDLLANKSKLRVLEDGKGQTQIIGLTEQIVDSCGDVLHLIKRGNAARTSGQTSANSNSSRSHAIFQILLRRQEHSDVYGKFSLIDLAGNERGADTSSSNRQTRMEGAEINKSLLALKECIRALGKKGTHLPFRVSKLTQVLRDSFIGENSRTCMIAMVSPGMNSCENTLNTLRYADRVKELGVTELETKIVNDDKGVESDMQYTDSDLERLRSLNERDMPADLYTFHEAVSQVQLAEDEVIDNHKTVIDFMEKVKIQATELYELTQNVDYDQDAYSAQWELLLSQQLTILEHAKNLVTEFRSKLSNEEKMSQRMQRH